jgi:uncharacterized membrane protein
MSFVYPLLLGGAALAGLPVLIHLMMRQKPKRLIFPALRFLREGRKSTTRRLKLRHLLLLALRMLLIALIVLALARPKVFHQGLGLQGDQPVAAILVIDTTPSMEYTVGGKTRLADARARARALLDQLPAESSVAILDTSEQLEEWSPTPAAARSRLDGLQIVHARPHANRANGTVTKQIAAAYRMFAKREQEKASNQPPVLFVFSDRTEACWQSDEVISLKKPDWLQAVFVDVGVERPEDLAIEELRATNDHNVPQQAFLPGQRIRFKVKVRRWPTEGSTANEQPTTVQFKLTDDPKVDERNVNLQPGESKELWFERQAAGRAQTGKDIGTLSPGLHQAEVQFKLTDEMPFNNAQFATFEIRDSRSVLIIADNTSDARSWKFDAEWFKLFNCEVHTVQETKNWGNSDFKRYPVICLVNVANPADLWGRLTDWVQRGGGLVVVPGGEGWEPNLTSYSDAAALKLLPATFQRDNNPIKVPREKLVGVTWEKLLPDHPMLKLFRDWDADKSLIFEQEGQEPRVIGYWSLAVIPDQGTIVVHYDDDKKTPAILERNVERGKVVMLTTSFDDKPEMRNGKAVRDWHNYTQNYFAPIFESVLLGYLAGEVDQPNFSYLPGQKVPVTFPAGSEAFNFSLFGPGIGAADGAVQRESPKQATAWIDQAVTPGNYYLFEGDRATSPFAAFSINPAPQESRLSRVALKDIEEVLGPDSVLPLDYRDDLLKLLKDRWPEPVELLPWLMILVLLLLAAENLFSNLFYRRAANAPGNQGLDAPTSAATEPVKQQELQEVP